MGATLHNWQLVEMAMCSLLTTVMRAPDPRLGAEMFYAVANFRDKLGLVDAAVRFTVWNHKRLTPGWEKLTEKIKKRAGRRNAIVHAHTVGDYDEPKLGKPLTLTNAVEANKHNPQAAYIDAKQMQEACRSFRRLARHIQEYEEQVREFLTPPR